MTYRRMLGAALLTIIMRSSAALRVAILADHEDTKWNASCRDQAACNLNLYSHALHRAASLNSSLLLFPEAYALQALNAPPEMLVSRVGSSPCDEPNVTAPQQALIACSARLAGVATVANFFVVMPNGTQHITDVVFSANGTVLAVYHKHHLFPGEGPPLGPNAPGPFAPTVVELFGRRWGLAICYEGVYPSISGDYSQFETLQAQGATALLWSIGGMVPDYLFAKHLATKFGMATFASECGKPAVAVDSSGRPLSAAADAKLSVANYTGNARVIGFEY